MNHTRETTPLLCLIGYRGTGKTTVAQRLAERMGWPWIDADVELERRAGKTIREIFEEEGEAGFRDRETAVVLDLALRNQWIVAFGGGAILREENRQVIRRGVVVWLQADPETIWQRMEKDPATTARRPNLTIGGLKEIEELLAARASLYQDCSDYTVATADKTPDQIADEVVCFLRAQFPNRFVELQQ